MSWLGSLTHGEFVWLTKITSEKISPGWSRNI